MATTKTLSADELAAAKAERATYGLPSDDASIATALGQGVDTGLSEWGMVVTNDELTALDLWGRSAFEGAAEQGVIPFAQSLPNYAGAYFDQAGGDSLTILLTSIAGTDQILRLAPPGKYPVSIRLAKYSYAALEGAVERIRDAWAGLYPDVELLNIAIESRENRLRAEVAESQMSKVDQNLTELVAKLGVAVYLAPGVKAEAASCYYRDVCSNPIKAATWGRWPQNPPVHESCAMGFWVSSSTGDEQLVTAGHCSGATPPDTQDCWYQETETNPGTPYGLLGCEIFGLNWYYGGNYDMMMIGGPDSQATNRIFDEGARITAFGTPVTGSSVCASLTKHNWVDCGTITDNLVSYYLNGYFFYGASYSGIAIIGGDSGSPVYHRLTSTTCTILGVVSGGVYFAITTGIFQTNGYHVVNW